MTEMTPSVTTAAMPAVQTKAASVKRTANPDTGNAPLAQGLYDPRNEHDACGVGFIAQMKGVKSHQIVKDGLAMLENLTHRGAVGADPLMGDGAGVLVQIPDRFFREEMARQGIELPPVGQYGVGHWFMPRDAELRAHIDEIIAESAQSEGLPLIGFRDVPVDNSSLSKAPDIAAAEPSSSPGLHRPHARHRRRRGIRGAALPAAQGHLRPHLRREQQPRHRRLLRVAVGAHHRLQGHVPGLPGRRLLQGSHRSALRDGADPRPPAVFDQHLPVVEAGASLPHGRPQWRNQHGARQQQLDGGAAGVGRQRTVRQQHLEAVADLL